MQLKVFTSVHAVIFKINFIPRFFLTVIYIYMFCGNCKISHKVPRLNQLPSRKMFKRNRNVFLFRIIFHFDSNSVPHFKRYLNSLRLRQADDISQHLVPPVKQELLLTLPECLSSTEGPAFFTLPEYLH